MYTEKAEQKLTSTLLNSFLCFLFVVVKLLCFIVQKHICCMVIYVWTIPNEAFQWTPIIYIYFFFSKSLYYGIVIYVTFSVCVRKSWWLRTSLVHAQPLRERNEKANMHKEILHVKAAEAEFYFVATS